MHFSYCIPIFTTAFPSVLPPKIYKLVTQTN